MNTVARRLPAEAKFERGWAALCFDGDRHCIAAMERTAARASRYVRTEFVLESTLLGQPGATQGFVALIVPPSTAEGVAPPTGMAEDFSAMRRAFCRNPNGNRVTILNVSCTCRPRFKKLTGTLCFMFCWRGR